MVLKRTVPPYRVLVVDDHPSLRESMAAAVTRLEGFEMAGLGSTIDEALTAARTGTCDIVLIDLHLRALYTPGQLRELSQIPNVILIAMSLDESARLCHDAIASGAAAFLSKKDMNLHLEPVLKAAIRRLADRTTA